MFSGEPYVQHVTCGTLLERPCFFRIAGAFCGISLRISEAMGHFTAAAIFLRDCCCVHAHFSSGMLLRSAACPYLHYVNV